MLLLLLTTLVSAAALRYIVSVRSAHKTSLPTVIQLRYADSQ
jgi:hypothetical protein